MTHEATPSQPGHPTRSGTLLYRDELDSGDAPIPHLPGQHPSLVQPAPTHVPSAVAGPHAVPREDIAQVPSEDYADEGVPAVHPEEAARSTAPSGTAPTTPRFVPPPSQGERDQPYVPPPEVVPVPGDIRHPAYSGPSDLALAHSEEQRQEHFEALAGQMENALAELEESEEKRDLNFRANEEERERMFMENERRRDEEALARRDGIWQELEDRLKSLPPPGTTPSPFVPPGKELEPGEAKTLEPETTAADAPRSETLSPAIAPEAAETGSILDSMREAASRHADDIQEIVRLERETLQAERDRAHEEHVADRERLTEEYQAHIRSLEAELAAVRKELEDEKLSRAANEAERRESERAEMLEQNEMMRTQMGELTNIVSEQSEVIAAKRQASDERWEIKQRRWEEKDEQDAGTRDMLNQILQMQQQMLNEQMQAKTELLEAMRESE